MFDLLNGFAVKARFKHYAGLQKLLPMSISLRSAKSIGDTNNDSLRFAKVISDTFTDTFCSSNLHS